MFYGISNLMGYSMSNPLYSYILNIYDLVWLGFMEKINHYRLFNAKSSLYILNIRFGLVLWHINHCRLFNAKSYSYIYIQYIGFVLVEFYGISSIVGCLMPNPFHTYIWFGLVLWHINRCRLFNAKSSLYIYIKCMIWFGWVGFYGISTIIGYLMQNSFYTYMLNMICKHFVDILKRAWAHFFCTQLNGFNCFCPIQIILLIKCLHTV